MQCTRECLYPTVSVCLRLGGWHGKVGRHRGKSGGQAEGCDGKGQNACFRRRFDLSRGRQHLRLEQHGPGGPSRLLNVEPEVVPTAAGLAVVVVPPLVRAVGLGAPGGARTSRGPWPSDAGPR